MKLKLHFRHEMDSIFPVRSGCLVDITFATGTDPGQLIGSDFGGFFSAKLLGITNKTASLISHSVIHMQKTPFIPTDPFIL